MRKWKSDLFRATLGPAEEAAAAAEPAGTQEKSNATACCFVSSSTQRPTIQTHNIYTLHVKLDARENLTAWFTIFLSHAHTHTQLPKHLRPEAETWKPSGHKQVKLPSVLEQVPNVQISGAWEHSSMSDIQTHTQRTAPASSNSQIKSRSFIRTSATFTGNMNMKYGHSCATTVVEKRLLASVSHPRSSQRAAAAVTDAENSVLFLPACRKGAHVLKCLPNISASAALYKQPKGSGLGPLPRVKGRRGHSAAARRLKRVSLFLFASPEP